MKNKTTVYVIQGIAAAALLLTAQISLAGSARWLLSPQDSDWENLSNWTAGGPPNGLSDTATFGPSSQTEVNISTSVELSNIVFTSDSDSFDFSIQEGELIISGIGVQQKSSLSQTFSALSTGQIIFNNTSTAADAIVTSGGGFFGLGEPKIIFNDSSTAGSAILVAGGGSDAQPSGAIFFNGSSTGGTARVEVFAGFPSHAPSGYMDISGHQSAVTIGSIEGDGGVLLGANDLTVGTNNVNTTFSGVIANDGHHGSLAKVGNGVLTLQRRYDYCIAPTVGLILVSNSFINLNFTGRPEIIASLVVDGVSQPPGVYGGPVSGAPHILPEFRNSGTVQVRPSTLTNISTRAFVQTGDNVMIGGFIVEGPSLSNKDVLIRAIGPELAQYGVPNALSDPILELHDSTGALIASNYDWQHTIIGGIINSDQASWIQSSGYAPTDPRESAMIVTLPPGNYTTIVRGTNNITGAALVEAYDFDTVVLHAITPTILSNISTRSFVQTGDDVMIGGFIIEGPGPKRVIVRAIGPELAQHGVPNPLADPTLELYNHIGGLMASNNNWMTTVIGGIVTTAQVQDIMASGHAPTDPSESAIIATLPPGRYTAIVRGVNNTTGVGLVEVYDLD